MDTCTICGAQIEPEARYFTDDDKPRHMLCDFARRLRAFMARVATTIEQHGWNCTSVFPTEDSPEDYPLYSYSTGFYEHSQHPELIVLGLPPKIANGMLWNLYRRVEEGEQFADGDQVSEILDGYDVRLRALPPDGRPLNVSRRYYQVDELPTLQVLWPDAEGNFPGEGCKPEYEALQDIELVRRYDDADE